MLISSVPLSEKQGGRFAATGDDRIDFAVTVCI
jgi:hypothetical protein